MYRCKRWKCECLGRIDNFLSWRLKKWSSEVFGLENRIFFRLESKTSATGCTNPELRTILTPLSKAISRGPWQATSNSTVSHTPPSLNIISLSRWSEENYRSGCVRVVVRKRSGKTPKEMEERLSGVCFKTIACRLQKYNNVGSWATALS